MATRSYPGGAYATGGLATTIPAIGRQLFTVPAGIMRKMEWLTCDSTMSATVGNRTIGLRIVNQVGNPIYMCTTSTAVTAAQVCGSDLSFQAIQPVVTTVRRNLANTGNTNVQVREGIGLMWLPPGWGIVIDDYADIDVADTMNALYGYWDMPSAALI